MEILSFIQEEKLNHDELTKRYIYNDKWLEYFINTSDLILSSIIWLEKNNIKSFSEFKYSLMNAINHIDEIINSQINEILHNEKFQKIESSWRGLEYLVKNEVEDNFGVVKIKIIQCKWSEIVKDAKRAIDFDQSSLFKLIYQKEFSMPGGEPFGLVVGDYNIRNTSNNILKQDIQALFKISQTAASSFCPFIMSADASIFGCDNFSELASVNNLNTQFEQKEFNQWLNLRKSDDTRFIGLTVPHVLFRKPYNEDGSRTEFFSFIEKIIDKDKDMLWGNSAFCFAKVIIRAYQENGWFTHIRGYKEGLYNQGVILPPAEIKTQLPGNVYRYEAPLNLKVSEKKEGQFSYCGFIPLSPVPESSLLYFSSNNALHNSEKHKDEIININSKLSSMIQYTLCVSRIAHYIKIMARDKVGAYSDAESIQYDFQKWLHKYTTASDDASDELRAKYPLNQAKIIVKEKVGSPGKYYSIIHLRPHFQLDQMVSTIKLITEISPSKLI